MPVTDARLSPLSARDGAAASSAPQAAVPFARQATAILFGALLVAILAGIVCLIDASAALAQSAGPFGVAAPEAGAAVPVSGFFAWVASEQSAFYRALTGALRALRNDPSAAFLLVGVSFAYGVFHAAGPGHGKAVITSYVLANGETLRRGILLSFVSAFVQALVAIALVAVATWALRLTAVEMTHATMAFELTSALLITALGLWLTWRKVIASGLKLVFTKPEPQVAVLSIAPRANASLAAGSGFGAPSSFGNAPAFGSAAGPALRFKNVPTGVDLSRLQAACAECGVSHMPDPSHLVGPFNLKRAISTVLAVGIRPCTGALIVLVFAFAQRQHLAGILSVFAMAVGTGITVAVLATLAVSARSVALRFAGADTDWTRRVLRAAEIGGALVVLLAGLTLLGACLVGTPTGG